MKETLPMNRIICKDSRAMSELPDSSVHLIITSPPYNAGKDYDNHEDLMPLDEYLTLLRDVWVECRRVLIDGGRICINVANIGRKPYIPLLRRNVLPHFRRIFYLNALSSFRGIL